MRNATDEEMKIGRAYRYSMRDLEKLTNILYKDNDPNESQILEMKKYLDYKLREKELQIPGQTRRYLVNPTMIVDIPQDLISLFFGEEDDEEYQISSDFVNKIFKTRP